MKRPSMGSMAIRGTTPIGLALVGTAFLSITPLWAVELPQPKAADPLTLIFVGVPNQLTLPPNFPIEAATSARPAAPHGGSGDATSYKPNLEEGEGDGAAQTPRQMLSPPELATAMTRGKR